VAANSDADKDPQAILSELRVDIDRIDADVHRLLMERGEIIDRLIAAKARQGGGSAFRPGREAEMMRRLAERHRGLLPLDTVESIWRIIIATFTYVQSNYSVHADISGGDAAMRDSERFHFGFTVPYIPHHGAAGVIDAVARSSGDLGMFRIDGGVTAGPWWTRLADPDAPKIIARLPFVERPDHPAGMPVFVIAKPLAEAAAREILLYCLHLERWRDGLPAALATAGGEIIGNAADETGLSVLVAIPAKSGLDRVKAALAEAGAAASRISEVGSHAARFSFNGHPAS
jgi:chorismate mutase